MTLYCRISQCNNKPQNDSIIKGHVIRSMFENLMNFLVFCFMVYTLRLGGIDSGETNMIQNPNDR